MKPLLPQWFFISPRAWSRKQIAEDVSHRLRASRLEQIPHVRLLAVPDHRLVAERHVPLREAWLLHSRDESEVFRQHGTGMRPRGLAPRMRHDRERQPQLRYAQRVVTLCTLRSILYALHFTLCTLRSALYALHSAFNALFSYLRSLSVITSAFPFLARLSTFASKEAKFSGKRGVGLHYTSVF